MLDIRRCRMFCRRECRYCEDYDGDILGYVEEEEEEEGIEDDKNE